MLYFLLTKGNGRECQVQKQNTKKVQKRTYQSPTKRNKQKTRDLGRGDGGFGKVSVLTGGSTRALFCAGKGERWRRVEERR